jgi:hypothetical protein
MNPEMNRASLESACPHQCIKIAAALKKRSGSMVKVYSHASKHAKEPKERTCSSCGGNIKKFSKRSNLTLEDS